MIFLFVFSAGDSLRRSGDLPGAFPLLKAELRENPTDPWALYRYAWTANRLEMPEEALEAAMAVWHMEPSDQWYLAECLRAMRAMGMYDEMLEYSDYVKGGGVCRYYLADAERELGSESTPSLDYFIEESKTGDDSSAADACAWMSILLDGEVEPESSCALAARAVELAPEESFYRCLLVENLADAGEVEASRQQLHYLRLNRPADYSYWRAAAALAEAEDDECRYIWALRRARGCRVCPEADRNLAWALYFSGRDAMRNGELDSARVLLEEIPDLGDSTQVYVQRADSILRLIDEFQETGSRGN